MGVSSTEYERAVATLDAVAWRGIMPGLERTRALLAALGNPHIGLRGALVAGTNGKGSVCATVDAACRAAGHKSVLLTSPDGEDKLPCAAVFSFRKRFSMLAKGLVIA